jgi:CubicO group peptidase (beta-lactamase class C family)
LLGPTYPAPTDLSSSDSKVQQAWSDLSTAFDDSLKQNKAQPGFGELSGANKVTFSASLFSLNDPAATDLQYHYTAPQVANAQHGTNKVDGDSIYRVASVSKLITTFAGMIELTDAQWNTPLSEIFPGLVSSSNDTASPIFGVQWDLITPAALASQLSGIPTLGLPQADLLVAYDILAVTTNTSATTLETRDGFPALPLTIFGPCTDLTFACSTEQFIKTIASDSPAQLPWATPGYSDLNFMLLGAVISKFTDKPLNAMYEDFIFNRLDMSSSYVNAPLSGSAFSDHSVVVGPINGSWSFAKNNPTIPSGGILSSISDLNKLGLALINSTLLDEVRTRAWLKPRTHTASLTESIGQPWEIIRYLHPSTGKVTDIYTKLGDSGAYGGMVAVIPDYGAGFTFLNGIIFPLSPPLLK